MKYLSIFIPFLISTLTFSCSTPNTGVYFSEMKENPKLFFDNGILTVKTQNSTKHSDLFIYEIKSQADKENKILSLSANQAINKEYKDSFKINLIEIGISNNVREWKFIWVDPDNTKNELHINDQFVPKNTDLEGNIKNLRKVYQYINNYNLAVCSQNYKFIGVYFSPYYNTMICSVFLGNYDIMNERKIIDSKIYYVAGLIECSDKNFNEASANNFYINLGNQMKVRYYNFFGNISYKNRNLIHFQSTDILNPPTMNATFKTIEVTYNNVYLPEVYGLDYNDDLNFAELAKKSIQTLYGDFSKIETEYKSL